MRDVVFTSFGPFRDIERNPSILVAAAAAAAFVRCGGTARAEELPVTFAAAAAAARGLGREAVRIHLGLAASRTVVSVERWGRPESGPEPDNDGEVGPVPAPGATALGSEGAALLVAALRAEGVEAELSEDAGGFVCNALLWGSLAAGAEACFVHLPPLSDEAAERLGGQLGRAVVRWLAVPGPG